MDKDILLEEYRQLMESQRDNTRIAYSWMSSIFLVLCSGLFFFGLTTDSMPRFIPAMVLGIFLCFIWVGLTEVFAYNIRNRFARIREISDVLGIPRIPSPKPIGQARTYVILFVILYIAVWILRLCLI